MSDEVRRGWILPALLLLGGGLPPALVAQISNGLARAPGARVVTVPRRPADVSMETSVAVDPRDVRHVMVSYQQWIPGDSAAGPAGMMRVAARVAWSADAGRTWSVARNTEAANYRISGDPSVTFDRHGHAFLAYIAYDHTGQLWYWAKGASRNGIFVRRSLDGGRTWEASHTPLIEYPTMEDPPFQDKGYLVADNNLSSPHQGNLYVGWTRYSLDKSEILFSRSTDDGKTWSAPIVISTDPGVPRGSASGAVVGFHATVGRDGAVYAVWPNGTSLVLAVSRDGGATFEPSRRILKSTLWALFSGITDFQGANGLPSIAIDTRTTPGRLFVTWGDYRYGDLDILTATSDDGGRSWAEPIRVNDDPMHSGKDQIRSWVAVDPSDGVAYVMFYDRRGDPKNLLPTVTLARSVDGGRSFRNYAWTITPSDPMQGVYGDYSGLAARDGLVYGAWMEQAAPTKGGPVLKVLGRAGGPTKIQIGLADFRSRSRERDAPSAAVRR